METWTRPDFPQPPQPPTQAEFYHGLDLQDMMFFWGARTWGRRLITNLVL